MSSEQHPKIYLYKRIVQAKLFIDSNYFKNIDLTDIAREAYFSKFHFFRLFKNIYGKTPHQYLTFIRIEKAMLLLQNNHTLSSTLISDVCYAVGFESLSSFSVLFKRMVGLTPSSFLAREQLKKEQSLKTPLRFVPGCMAFQYGWKENSNFEEKAF